VDTDPVINDAPPVLKSVVQLPVAWVLVLIFIFFAVRGRFSFEVGAGYDLNSLSAEDSSSIGAIGGALAYLVVATLVMLNLKRVLQLALQMKWLTLLALLTIVSAIWSQNPFRSFSYGICYLLSTLFGYYLVLRFDFEQLIKILMFTGVVICVASAAFVIGLPQYAFSYDDPRNPGAWLGIFPTRTGAAQVLTFFMGPGLVVGTNGPNWRQFAYVFMISFFIVMTRPVTGLILMFFYAACMTGLYLLRTVERKTALTLGFILVSSVVMVFIIGLPQMSSILQLFGRDATLTGRTEIWQALLESVAKRPFLGFGYAAFWQGLNGESANLILSFHWIFAYAHNGFLEVLLQVGVIGLVIFLVTLVKAFKDGWYCLTHKQTPVVEWCVGLLLLTCLYNIDEETLLFSKDMLSIFYIVACSGLALQATKIKQERSRQDQRWGIPGKPPNTPLINQWAA
jgi:exopolysaccharide production protein ExoQ